MNRKRQALIDGLEQSGKEFTQCLAQFSEAELHAVPAPNAWTIHQVAAHMRDVERYAFLVRAERIRKEEHPTVPNFDQEAWDREHYSVREPVKTISAEFRTARRKLVRQLRQATDADWDNWAVHSTLGKISLDWIASHCYYHTLEHIAQMGYAHEKTILQKLNA